MPTYPGPGPCAQTMSPMIAAQNAMNIAVQSSFCHSGTMAHRSTDHLSPLMATAMRIPKAKHPSLRKSWISARLSMEAA